VVKEINPRFYVDSEDNVSYVEDHMRNQPTLFEHKESKLNPELMMGDEIMVVSTEGIHDFGAPELYKPYLVVGIKHGTTMNREIHKWTHGEDEEQTPDRWDSPEVPRSRLGFRKEFDTIPYTYYQIEPIGMTDEERTGAMLAGGGRMKPMYIFPSPSEHRGSDQWILRPGFLRGEHLTEHNQPGLNPELEVGDIVRVIDVDGEHARMPDRFGLYKVIEMKQDNATQEFYYDIVPYPSPHPGNSDYNSSSYSHTSWNEHVKTLYRGDKWIRIWKEEIPEYLKEHKETKLNPELEVGDEIIVVHHTKNNYNFDITWPELYKPYVVVKIKHPNKYQPSNAQTYYELIPAHTEGIDYSFKKGETTVTGIDLRGPGVKRIYPTDKWIFNPGFLNEQKSFMDNSDQAMERARKEALRRGLFNSLNTLFDVLPYEEGEIVHNDVNMGVYEKETGQFVPVDYIYDPIMENMGMQVTEDDLQLFIDIITEWVNMRMSSHNIEEYVN